MMANKTMEAELLKERPEEWRALARESITNPEELAKHLNINVEEIKEAIIKIRDNKKYRDDLIKKGFIRSKEFTWERCAKETLEILLSV